MNALKPCPFCGGNAKLRSFMFLGVYSFYIDCVECSAQSNKFDTIEEAVKAWNIRTAQIQKKSNRRLIPEEK